MALKERLELRGLAIAVDGCVMRRGGLEEPFDDRGAKFDAGMGCDLAQDGMDRHVPKS